MVDLLGLGWLVWLLYLLSFTSLWNVITGAIALCATVAATCSTKNFRTTALLVVVSAAFLIGAGELGMLPTWAAKGLAPWWTYAFTDFSVLVRPPTTTVLWGSGPGLTAGLRLDHLPALREVVLRWTAVSDATLASLPPTVTELDVGGCSGLTAGLRLNHLPALTRVVLFRTAVSDVTLALLPPTVTELRADDCGNLTASLRLDHLPALTKVELHGTAVSDGTLASLPPTVTELVVSYRRGLTAEAIATLKARGVNVNPYWR